MARIRTTHRGGDTRVVFTGKLTAGDMGRLEHACREALTNEPLRLTLDLRGVTDVDRTAVAVLARLELRGAQVVGRAQAVAAAPSAAGVDEIEAHRHDR